MNAPELERRTLEFLVLISEAEWACTCDGDHDQNNEDCVRVLAAELAQEWEPGGV